MGQVFAGLSGWSVVALGVSLIAAVAVLVLSFRADRVLRGLRDVQVRR